MKQELTESEIERIKQFVPTTVRKRKLILDSIVQELNRRNFKALDETKQDDLKKVISIVSDMYPESNRYKIREYAEVSIRLWKRQRA